ncbi:FAD-dependent oxidoreductase [Myxosarcina sp. GI1]|uniref:FAD-dependent oxidoreductase n=1 Tax=Myxosarcina sp. GI1 TaxID=1541065 RepID=UPI00056C2AAE|nr:FAD-dependent oxidoreductase [Myxosarcina sp. GI1]
MQQISTEVLVVGGGTGGVAAAIQAARRGVATTVVSEFSWLGGMLTSAGVCAPDGNELAAWQTGLWGKYLRELQKKQSGGLDNAWVSLFTYHPQVGAKIFANWVRELPNLNCIYNYKPLAVVKQGNKITKVEFEDFVVTAKVIIDATELGDLLALAQIPHRWGWELQAEFNEPSAPVAHNQLTAKYPVQAPTWVFMLQHSNNSQNFYTLKDSSPFRDAWASYGAETFLNYGKLQNNLYMINWPIVGNDYGENLNRLIASETEAKQFLAEAYQHSYDFAVYIQSQLPNYSMATNIFPQSQLNSAFALHPYYRESRRLKGKTTITENDILPIANGCVAPLPINANGEVSAVAIGNYANDHHYPGFDFSLQPKSIRWGGRWTGTPFTIPYEALVPESTEGLLVCEKNISVSHIANGSTRLQPVVMNIGQAAGMAAALCIEANCQPQKLSVRKLQEALLTDKDAPAGVVPLYNLPPEHPQWLYWQRYYLDSPQDYPVDGNCPTNCASETTANGNYYRGTFHNVGDGEYAITLKEPQNNISRWQLITLNSTVNERLQSYWEGKEIFVVGRFNLAGNWFIAEAILS